MWYHFQSEIEIKPEPLYVYRFEAAVSSGSDHSKGFFRGRNGTVTTIQPPQHRRDGAPQHGRRPSRSRMQIRGTKVPQWHGDRDICRGGCFTINCVLRHRPLERPLPFRAVFPFVAHEPTLVTKSRTPLCSHFNLFQFLDHGKMRFITFNFLKCSYVDTFLVMFSFDRF